MLDFQLKTKVKEVMTTPAITLSADKVVSGMLPDAKTDAVPCCIWVLYLHEYMRWLGLRRIRASFLDML
jgi:hypothetical protein